MDVSLQTLTATPGRAMINDCFPVIYLGMDGRSRRVWVEGGKGRRDETKGERGRKFPALDLTWTRE